MNANRILLFSENLDTRYSAYRGDTRSKNRLGVLVHRVQRQCVGVERQKKYRKVGGIGLRVSRCARHLWKLRLSHSRLHVLRRGIDVTVERELDRYVRKAVAVGRTDRPHSGNRGKLALERCRDCRCHGLRIGTRLRRINLNRRVIDGRQRRHRQRAKTNDAEQENRECQKRSHDRTLNENARHVHD